MSILQSCLFWLIRGTLAVRYKVEVKGLEKLTPDAFPKKGGILIMPNHPAILVDPVIVGLSVWKQFKPRPVMVEYMFNTPVINKMMRYIRGLPIPNFSSTSNSIKRKKSDDALKELIDSLKKGENVLIYPAGKTKNSGYEEIGGNSGVHRILQEVPEANVLLVRTTGLWGSSFSRARTGQAARMFPMILEGIKTVFKNLLFFVPKRKVVIELQPAPADFPFHGSRMEINRYLEEWYNKGYNEEGEPLNLVPYSFWSKEKPQVAFKSRKALFEVSEKVQNVPLPIQNQIKEEVSRLAKIPVSQITPASSLSSDLGLDSVDISELAGFLHEQFDLKGIPTEELTTVGKLMELAASKPTTPKEAVVEEKAPKAWFKGEMKGPVASPQGDTIQEVFLNNCARYSNSPACADERSGILTFKQMKLRVILLAEQIAKMPDERIGIMLPASVAANVVIMATLLAGKTPVMINWTVGPRPLESVVASSGIRCVLSAWSFVDRLENIEFGPLDNIATMLEDFRHQISLKDKLKAFWLSLQSTKSILKHFPKNPTDHAVILFTSGTEGDPKGVPLTQKNILSNLKGVEKAFSLRYENAVLNILPPFHSFGFTVTGLMPLMAGIKVFCYPDPTDGEKIAHLIQKWQCTIAAMAPTFLKGVLTMGKKEQLASLQLVATGAEKIPEALREQAQRMMPQAKLVEGYGITECSPVITFNPPGGEKVGVGIPLPGVELRIIHHETYEPCAPYQVGLVLCRGESVFSGYLKPTAKSPFIEVEGEQWYNTGDLGFLDANGNLTLSGRLKRFVKIGGEMISLVAIEEALHELARKEGWPLPEELPGIAVTAREYDGKTELLLYTVCNVDLQSVNKGLKAAGFSNLVRLTEAKHIKEIPLLGSGKINYRALPV